MLIGKDIELELKVCVSTICLHLSDGTICGTLNVLSPVSFVWEYLKYFSKQVQFLDMNTYAPQKETIVDIVTEHSYPSIDLIFLSWRMTILLWTRVSVAILHVLCGMYSISTGEEQSWAMNVSPTMSEGQLVRKTRTYMAVSISSW